MINEKNRIKKHFDLKASSYESSAVLQNEVCQRMLQRLDYVALQPQVVLDAGAGTGRSVRALMKRYKSTQLVAMDLSPAMLMQTRQKSGWWRKPDLVCADAECLPLADASVDLVFSNLMLQWCLYEQVFAEFWRVLKPGGLLMFSSFGPDTLKELRSSWAALDDDVHVNQFVDMHDLGDALLAAGMAEPVMDVDMFTLTYPDAKSVMQDLKKIGANTTVNKNNRGLLTPAKLQKVIDAYESYRVNELLPATFEVVYGHAWKSEKNFSRKKTSEFQIPISDIGKSRNL
ncbi:MAG TPA: malonyl-ACP O-methyltransferase BioC [Gammaproteobacteria bacterium]